MSLKNRDVRSFEASPPRFQYILIFINKYIIYWASALRGRKLLTPSSFATIAASIIIYIYIIWIRGRAVLFSPSESKALFSARLSYYLAL